MIKVVALDLGFVVLEIEIENQLKTLGIHEPWTSLSKWQAHWDFETGKKTDAQFYEDIRQRFNLKLADHEIAKGWLGIIKGFIPGIPELLSELHGKVKLVAITNTNSPHLKHFGQWPEFKCFDKIYASHEVGFRKPNREIYEHVVADLKVSADEIAFFDDLADNIATAKEVGFQAYRVYRSAEFIRETLRHHKVLK